eukprot:SAG31_NODE_2462_length_5654_cov_465.384740_4_plen_80_part_00
MQSGGGFGASNYDKFAGAQSIGSDDYYGRGAAGGNARSPPSLMEAARAAAPVVGDMARGVLDAVRPLRNGAGSAPRGGW